MKRASKNQAARNSTHLPRIGKNQPERSRVVLRFAFGFGVAFSVVYMLERVFNK